MALYRPKQFITFPNQWAVESFLLKIKRSFNWEFQASADGNHFQIKPRGSAEAILIGLNKTGSRSPITLEINAEKANLDSAWNFIYQIANLYRC